MSRVKPHTRQRVLLFLLLHPSLILPSLALDETHRRPHHHVHCHNTSTRARALLACAPLTVVQNVEFLNNPARFLDPYKFRVTFECIAPLPDGEPTTHKRARYGLRLTCQILNGASYTCPRPGMRSSIRSWMTVLWGLYLRVSPFDIPLCSFTHYFYHNAGVNSFEFEGSAPTASTIPPEDVLGVAALILTGSYNDQEFVRVGYYQVSILPCHPTPPFMLFHLFHYYRSPSPTTTALLSLPCYHTPAPPRLLAELTLTTPQNTEYDSEDLRENPPKAILFDRLTRDISTKPRVTRFQIKWSVCPSSSTYPLLRAPSS